MWETELIGSVVYKEEEVAMLSGMGVNSVEFGEEDCHV